MKKIAVLLAGCGRLDGSEIHESVLTLLAITQAGYEYQCFGLDLPQHHVTNHLTNEKVAGASRNMLEEAARIARGDIQVLNTVKVEDYAALIIPGGNGVAYNLFDFALHGKDCTVRPEVKDSCLKFTSASKPVGFICISPAMIPGIYGPGIELTISDDKDQLACSLAS